MKIIIFCSFPILLFGGWDVWWKKPPTLSYYEVRSYNQLYTKYDRIFLREGKRWGFSPIFLKAIATQETGINIKLKDNGNRNGSMDIGLMRINNIHKNELWYWKRWTLNDMRTNPNKAVYFAAKILKKCIKIYGLHFNDNEKLANTFSCYNGSQLFYSKDKKKVVGDPNLIYGKKVLYHISMYNKVGSPLIDGEVIAYDYDFSSIENINNGMDAVSLMTVNNIMVGHVNKVALLKHTFPWKVRMD